MKSIPKLYMFYIVEQNVGGHMNSINNINPNTIAFNGLATKMKTGNTIPRAYRIIEENPETTAGVLSGSLVASGASFLQVLGIGAAIGTLYALADSMPDIKGFMHERKIKKTVSKCLNEEGYAEPKSIHKMPASLITLLKSNLPQEDVELIIRTIRDRDLEKIFYENIKENAGNDKIKMNDSSFADRRILTSWCYSTEDPKGKVAILTAETLHEAQKIAGCYQILDEIPNKYKGKSLELLKENIICPETAKSIPNYYGEYPKRLNEIDTYNFYGIEELSEHSVLLDLLKLQKNIDLEFVEHDSIQNKIVYALKSSNGKTIIPKNNQDVKEFIISLLENK